MPDNDSDELAAEAIKLACKLSNIASDMTMDISAEVESLSGKVSMAKQLNNIAIELRRLADMIDKLEHDEDNDDSIALDSHG